jgi:hypothetical protein
MAESQRHGFEIERLVRESACYGSAPQPAYGAEFDIPAGHSNWDGAPAQVKACAAKGQRVMLGDALRNRQRDEPFELIVALWEQDGPTKHIASFARMAFKPQSWGALFGSATEEDIRQLDQLIKAVPVGAGPQPAARAQAHAARRALTEAAEPVLSLQPKIGSSSPQRRLQASCKLADLMAHSDRCDLIGPERFDELRLPGSVFGPPRERKGSAEGA